MKKELPKLNIRPHYALGYADHQIWLFLKYDDEELENLEQRLGIKRSFMANGDEWWGITWLFNDTHENGIDTIQNEIKLAKKAIKILKKTWKQNLSNI